MKEGIHPKYLDVEARCACGATWKTRSTKPELHLEICNNCHPFFTGRQKLVDTEGRVERFTKRFGAQTSESRKQAAKATRQTQTKKQAAAQSNRQRVRHTSRTLRTATEQVAFVFLAIFFSSRARRWRRAASFRRRLWRGNFRPQLELARRAAGSASSRAPS